eukprot:scaffold7917_cov61-Phaeocystis_antarctica.AAC.1
MSGSHRAQLPHEGACRGERGRPGRPLSSQEDEQAQRDAARAKREAARRHRGDHVRAAVEQAVRGRQSRLSKVGLKRVTSRFASPDE